MLLHELLKGLKKKIRKKLGRFRNLGSLEGVRAWDFWRARRFVK